MNIDKSDTAVVFIDPQNEVLSEKGLAWPLVHESLRELDTIANMERIFKAAKAQGFEVFISPHYFYPTDKGWKFNGALETDEATSGMFARKGVLNLNGLAGSGADWLERFKPYIEDGKTIVVAPHRVWGRRPTISCYSSANAGSATSFSAECWPTCASNLTCANCSSKVSR
jgi:nicotinamidase-related amidase